MARTRPGPIRVQRALDGLAVRSVARLALAALRPDQCPRRPAPAAPEWHTGVEWTHSRITVIGPMPARHTLALQAKPPDRAARGQRVHSSKPITSNAKIHRILHLRHECWGPGFAKSITRPPDGDELGPAGELKSPTGPESGRAAGEVAPAPRHRRGSRPWDRPRAGTGRESAPRS